MSHPHLIFLLVSCFAACGRAYGESPEPAPEPNTQSPTEHGEHGEHGEHETEPAASGRLQIDPDMLQDLRLTTAVVRARLEVDTIQAIGEIRLDPDAASHVGSLVAARIIELRARVGDLVTAGTVLAVLESPEVGRARSELIAARSQLGAAQRIYGRKQRLANDQVVSASDSDRASAEVAQARGAVDSANALLAALGATDDLDGKVQLTGGQFLVRARSGGTVLTRVAVLGAHTDAEETLFTLGDLSRLIAVVHPFERDAIHVRPGVASDVTLAALPGRPLHGKVLWTSPEVDPVSHALDVVLSVEDPEHVARPGMTVTAELALGSEGERVITVPLAALQRVEDDWVVFKPGSEAGVYEIVEVGRGRDLGDTIEVLSGLSDGDTIVVDGAFVLKAEAAKAAGGGEEEE